MSSDGTYALIGGPVNANDNGGAWIFTRDSFGNWSQVGGTLIGNDQNGTSKLGSAVSLSGNAIFAIIGGPGDDSEDYYGVGATWVFHSLSTTVVQPTASPTNLK